MSMLELGNSEIGFGAMIAAVVIGCVATYRAVRKGTTRELESLRGQVAELNASVQRLSEKAAEPPKAIAAAAGAQTAAAPIALAPQPVATPVAAAPVRPEIAEEVLAIITAAVAAFLGKRARVRRTKLVQTSETSAWAQQGRVIVQASHNLNIRHHR